jgi:hypothetical protein
VGDVQFCGLLMSVKFGCTGLVPPLACEVLGNGYIKTPQHRAFSSQFFSFPGLRPPNVHGGYIGMDRISAFTQDVGHFRISSTWHFGLVLSTFFKQHHFNARWVLGCEDGQFIH